MTERIEPITPGDILLEEFLKPLGISGFRLAKEIDMPPVHLQGIIAGKRPITANLAGKLAKYFGVTPEFWLNLQDDYNRRVIKS
jgi:antitoxin HigA-1